MQFGCHKWYLGGGVTVYLKHWSITYVPCLVVEQLQFHCIIEFVSQLGLVSWRKWIQPSSIFQYYNVFGLAHNTIHIPNNFCGIDNIMENIPKHSHIQIIHECTMLYCQPHITLFMYLNNVME